MTSYYVYYRVDAAQQAELRRRVRQLIESVARECGVLGRLMRRRDEPGTWMEVYEGVADDARFEAVIGREVAGLRLESLLEEGSARRVERFVPLQG